MNRDLFLLLLASHRVVSKVRGPRLLGVSSGPEGARTAGGHPGYLPWRIGRTIYSQGKLTPTEKGRDHHPRCFSLWMAGAGIKGGVVNGETDEFSYNIVKDLVHIRDFQATILNQFGIDHERFTYKDQGLDQKLTGTGTTKARVVKEILV